MPYPRVVACEPLAKGDGVNEAGLPVLRVMAVGLPVKFAVVQDTDAEQVDAPEAIVQSVALTVPEGPRLNVAVTFRAWVILTTHVPIPEQPSPDQPAKEPEVAEAERVTLVPLV